MIEVCPNLHIGSERDEQSLLGQAGWFFIHACKEPYHRQALGYTGRAAAKTACIGLGLPCISPYEMLRRERARFVLGPTPRAA